MAIIDDVLLHRLQDAKNKYIHGLRRGSRIQWPLLDDAIKDCITKAQFGDGEIAHLPQALIDELRQALLDNAPPAWRTGGELDSLAEQMQDGPAVLRVAIHFVVGTGRFIRQEK